jgi:hypothetical protein
VGSACGAWLCSDALEDDDGDGDGDDDEGDDDGRVRNIYAGARAVLGRQASVWPAASDLVFNAPAALAEDPVRFAPLKGCFYALARLSATAAGLAVGPPSPSSSSSSSSSSAASAAVGELAELLGRPSNGIADLLVAAAAAEPPCGAAPLLPQKLWRWLLDVAAFHASDLVGSAAAACALRIVASLPPLGATADGAAAGDEGQGWKEVWDPSRPLSFGLCCRPLVALGLDPMADDPTTPLDRHGAASGSLDGMGGLRAAAAPPFAQPLFPGPALARCVAVWAACFASNRHALSGEESVDLFACLALIGVDPWALSVPNLLVKRDECLRCLLRVLPTTPPDMPADDADGDGGGGGVGVAVWPAGAVRRVAALVRAAPFADTKLLLLRSLPLASTQGRGQVLLAKCACDFADEAFPARSKSPPPPAATAAADAAAGTGAAAASVAASEAEQVAAAGAMATRLLCEEYKSEASLQRLFGGKASRLAGRGPRALGLLLGVADLLLAAASGPGDWSVPKLNGPMASLVERVSGFLRVSVDPEVRRCAPARVQLVYPPFFFFLLGSFRSQFYLTSSGARSQGVRHVSLVQVQAPRARSEL